MSQYCNNARGFLLRYLDDNELVESETVLCESDEKKNMYHMTMTHDIKGQSGVIRVNATNIGGEANAESKLTVSGRAPEFIENPLKCTILEGRGDHYAYTKLYIHYKDIVVK